MVVFHGFRPMWVFGGFLSSGFYYSFKFERMIAMATKKTSKVSKATGKILSPKRVGTTKKTSSKVAGSLGGKKHPVVEQLRQKVLEQVAELEEVVDTEGECLVQPAGKMPTLRPGEGAGSYVGQRAPHGIVRARAGTGKTFTLIMGVANMFRDHKLADSYTFKGPRGKKLDYAAQNTLWAKVEKECGRWKNPLTGFWEYPEKVRKIVPSKQQKEVWEFMGKEVPRTVCYVAFNNSIVEEFGEKYEWLVQLLEPLGMKLEFRTIHSLGNQACRDHYKMRGWKAINKFRVSDLLSVFWGKDLREVWKEKADLIKGIQELVGICKLTLTTVDSDDALEDLCIHYDIGLEDKDELFRATRHILQQCREVSRDGTGRIDFNDMVWLPVINNLHMQQFDLLLVDEAQDLNRCQQELILKVGKRIILVGDERQAIYGFAGADTDSIDRMQGLLGGVNTELSTSKIEQLRLTQTRRCGKAIVEHAKRLVPDFEAHEGNGPGKVSRTPVTSLEEEPTASPYSLGEKDMVLCRTNAPLVGLAFRMLKAGKRVNIKGRDIGEGLKAFIKKSKAADVSEFLIWLEDFQRREVERINKRRNVDSEALVTLEDKCLCLRTFSEGAITVKDLYKAIDEVFKGKVCPQCKKSYDEQQKQCWDCKVPLVNPEGTLCSSIHRAKGLESKRVFILRPDLMPHPMAKSQWAKGQETNLMYVAETRAIEELVYVDGKVKEEVTSE